MVSLAHILQAHRDGFFGEPPGNFISRLFKAKKLRHNEALYQQFGLKKGIHDPISSKDFGYSLAAQMPWLDMPGIGGSLSQNTGFQQLELASQMAVRQFTDQGYCVLPGFFSDEDLAGFDHALRQQKIVENMGEKDTLPGVHDLSDQLDRGFFRHEKLLHLLHVLMGKKIVPYQTIYTQKNRAQRAQADSLYLTTQPPGYHIGCWLALENMDAGNAPFFCHPGSHRLPYLTTQHLGPGDENDAPDLPKTLRIYEDTVAEILAENSFEKTSPPLQKGDLIVWHTNLLHGSDADAPCHGLAAHYFCEGVICYHEILRRGAMLKQVL